MIYTWKKIGKIHKAVFEMMIQRQAEETSRLIGKDIIDGMKNLKAFKKNAKVIFDQMGFTGCDADFDGRYRFSHRANTFKI